VTFQEWLRKVARRAHAAAAVDIFDMVDRPLSDWYNEGVKPGAAVVALISGTEPERPYEGGRIETEQEYNDRQLERPIHSHTPMWARSA